MDLALIEIDELLSSVCIFNPDITFMINWVLNSKLLLPCLDSDSTTFLSVALSACSSSEYFSETSGHKSTASLVVSGIRSAVSISLT